MREAKGNVLAFIDCDCEPDRKWLEKGIATLGEYEVVGGRLMILVDDVNNMSRSEAFERVFAFRNSRYVTRLGFTVTASMFVFRSVFDTVGGFENFVPEDIEWCRRARARGFSIGYAEESIIQHAARKTMTELKRKWKRMTLESYALTTRERNSRLIWLLRSWVVLISVIPHFFYVMTTARLDRLRDRFAAASALAEIRLYRFVIAHRIFAGRAP